MKIFDCHIHIFADKVVQNVQKKSEMVGQLKLQTIGAEKRTSVERLKAEMAVAGVAGALMLPTANVAGVGKTNRDCIETAEANPLITTAGTLHPDVHDLGGELHFLQQHHVRMIKLCTFSQGFILTSPSALEMFKAIQSINQHTASPFAVILDTLYTADRHFGTRPEFNTTPWGLASLADEYPDISFIGAHMGGLDAPFDELSRHLGARPNLYLDTSNAAHTLSKGNFCDLVARHGPDHILFGTDWPWFSHEQEIALIDSLLDQAGFSEAEKSKVFGTNICRLLGL